MKRIHLIGGFWLFALCLHAQTAPYTVDGKTYDLQTDVAGPITLLWNSIDQEYRYFIKKDASIVELINKKVAGQYTNSYKQQLKSLTTDAPIPTHKTKLTLASLRKFANTYNTQIDPNYTHNSKVAFSEFRLGGFVGLSNNVFSANSSNATNTQLGIDFEILDASALPRHAVVMQYKQILTSDDFDFSSSQFSINYRFKFIKSSKIDVFLNTKLATLTFASSGAFETVKEEEIVLNPAENGTNFQGPILFGLGSDITLGKGYLTLNYLDIYAVFLDDNGEFPLDFSIGYKFIL